MPSYRVTDAAHVAPYLTHAVSHHGQVTLVPPDNLGRVRQVKPKKNRSRQRQERIVRAEEDVRFNTGPRPLRNLVDNRGGRRPERQARDEGYRDEAYPDYPPPSFLEAISTPLASECPNNATQPMSPVATSCHSSTLLPTSSSPSLNQPFPHPNNGRPARNDVDSDTSSLEIIDMPEERLPSGSRLEEEVRRDWKNRRGVEFPTPPDSSRGRTKSRVRTILDSDPEDAVEDAQPQSSLETSKRRHMSLSPLRTFFPYRPMAVHDRAFSAHPSPNSSPYSSRSSLPFLSTTSLKMSMSTTSFTSSPRSESFLSRKLLPSFLGKERATGSKEQLETWEVVESESSGLTSTTETTGTPPTPTLLASSTQEANAAPLVDQSLNASTHPLSLRDRKAPLVPFVNRPRRQTPPPRSPPVDPATVPHGPVLTSVRTRKPPPPPPPKKKPQIISASPLGHDSWRRSSIEVEPISQRALATPLPSTPFDSDSDFASAPTTPTTPNAEGKLVSVRHPTQADVPFSTTATETASCTSDADVPDSPGPTVSRGHPNQSYPLVIATNHQTSFVSDASPISRHHYPGRPLPQPPSTTLLADMIETSCDNSQIGAENGSRCPEGLLIDLEDNSLVENPNGSTPTTWFNESGSLATSSSSSVDLLGSIAVSQRDVSSEPTSSARDPSGPPFSEITDLDVLVSRIGDEEERQDGSGYDDLLLLSEFIGPATPTSRTQHSSSAPPATNKASRTKSSARNVPLLASVQVERRRTTKDGRVKLKLVLIDVSVDKCGICLTQFRSGDSAQMGSACKHAFHEKCLEKWLARSKTCPMCRVPLTGEH